ncbi:MAG: hypothetical protein ACTHMS_08075 [Jatrophihabitans sp.]|uniref:hypothetical protein n=1 Tax=Jatrophihabitans sp. TaxID=1932789 RepID=UPI003F7F3274
MTAQTLPQDPTDERRAAAACRLYDAECALHAAHAAHEDAWVAAASQKLHDAVEAWLTLAAR